MKHASLRNRTRWSGNGKGRNTLAVSEAIGTILMLGITTVMVGIVAVWATTIGGPEEEKHVDLSANIKYDGSSDIYYIAHESGEALYKDKIEIHIKVAYPADPDNYHDLLGSPYKINQSDDLVDKGVGTNGYWETGETWSKKYTTAYSRLGTIVMQVVYFGQDGNILLYDSELSQGDPGSKLPDLSISLMQLMGTEGNRQIMSEFPTVNVTISNIGDVGSTAVDPGDVSVMIFDGEKYMGTADLDQNGAMAGYDNSGDTTPNDKIDVGETWVSILDTTASPTSTDWRSQNGWAYTGRHTVYTKVTPLDRERKYSNNYASIYSDVFLTTTVDTPSGPDPEIDANDVVLSNRNPKSGETVTVTVYLKNKGDANLLGNSDPTQQCWFVISTQPIIRSGLGRNIFTWAADLDDDDTAMTRTQPTCVKKNISLPAAGQISYTFSWVAHADYPGQTRSIFMAVDANHSCSSESPDSSLEVVTYTNGDNPDNNYDWISIQVMPKVLVVDNDGVETGSTDDITSRILEGLQGAGISVDGLVKATATSPPYTNEGMAPYDIIIWVGGRSGAPLSSINLNNLTQAMNDKKYVWLIGNQVLRSLLAAPITSPNVLSGGGGVLNNIFFPTTTGETFIHDMLGIQGFYTGANPLANTVLTVLDQTTIGKTVPSTLTNWMLGEPSYDMSSPGTNPMELPQTARITAAGEEISQIITPSDSVLGTTYYNSIALNRSGGYKAVFTGFDFASLSTLNEEINITYSVMSWFNWKMNIGDDLALTDMNIEPASPKFMDTVNITVIARNNGITLHSNFIMFYVTGEDGIEKQIPTYGSDSNPVEVVIPGGGQVIKTKSWLASDTGLHKFRAVIDPYYILPEVSETNNDLDYSISATTTSIILQNVLIVDDDGGTAGTDLLNNTLSALTYQKMVWDYSVKGRPSVNDLKFYNTVLWNTGSSAGHILDASADGPQDHISRYLLGNYPEAKYLDMHNETLWLLGNGFISGAGTYLAGNFFHDYFGVGVYSANTVSASTDLVGKSNNPISHGIAYQRSGGGNTDDRINKAADLTGDDALAEVYFAGAAGTDCVGIGHTNSFYYYNTLISTTDMRDINIPGLSPSKDTQIIFPLSGFGYGSSSTIKIGWTAVANQRAALLQWDLSVVPATATIDSAVLKFYTTGMVGATVIPTLYAQPINDNVWVEGTDRGTAITAGATWTQSSFPTTNWVGTVPRLQSLGPGINTVYTSSVANVPMASSPVIMDVKTMVQAWVAGTIPNRGLALTPYNVFAPSSGINEIYSKECSDPDLWPRLIISYTYNGVSGQSPTGKENAVAEMLYMGMHWLALKDPRPDFRCTDIDITLNDPNPQLGNSYVISATIWNTGDGVGSCTVRFMDGNTLIKTSTIYLQGGANVVDECIWVPLYAGSGSASSYRSIIVSLDPLNKVTEIFDTFNNRPTLDIPVYFLYDDFEYDTQEAAENNWVHEATIVNINGESTLDFLDNAQTNITSRFTNYSFEQTSWLQDFTTAHSENSSYHIKEATGGAGVQNADLLVGIVLDDSRSMQRDLGGGITPLMKAQEAAIYLLDQLSDDSIVAVYHFSGSSESRASDFTKLDIIGRPLVYYNISTISNPPGQTVIWDAIGLAYNEVNASRSKWPTLTPALVVLSDGSDYQSSDTSSATTNKIECGSDAWCPWHFMSEGSKTYTSHWGKYSLPYSTIPGVWYKAGTYGGSFDGTRDGLLGSPIPIYTIGLALEHHDPPDTPSTTVWCEAANDPGNSATYTGASSKESGTVEYNLWRLATTSNAKYYYAPSSAELKGIFGEIARALLASAGSTRGGSGEATRATVSMSTVTLTADWSDSIKDQSGGTDDGNTALEFGKATKAYRSVIRWTTSSLSDYIYVDSLRLSTVCNDPTDATGLIDFHPLTVDPIGQTLGDRYTAAASGTEYINDDTAYRTIGRKNHTLPAAANVDFTSHPSYDWFGIGIHEELDNNADGYIYGSGHSDAARRPTLTVNYYADDIYEQNDVLASSYNLGSFTGARTYSNLYMVDASDYYTIPGIYTGQDIIINLDFLQSEGNIDVFLYGPDGTTLVASSTSVTDDEGISFNANKAGNYYVKVSAPTTVHCTYTMTIMIPPLSSSILEYPRNPYPMSGSTDVALHPILSWSGGDPGVAHHYGVWIGMKVGLEARVTDDVTGLPKEFYGESFDPGVLVPGQTYYWYVLAYDASNEATAVNKSSKDFAIGSPPTPVGRWSFTVTTGTSSTGNPADYELNPLDTRHFSLSDARTAKLTFFQKYNIAPTINGAYLMLGVKYRGGTTAWDMEDPYNYRYYYITPDQTYNSNMYLGNKSYDRPYLGMEGANFTIAASNYAVDYNGDGDSTDANETRAMWCWNGKSSGGTFDWQYSSVNLMGQIAYINAHSTANIDPSTGVFKIRFSFFYFGAGTGSGWWIDDVKVVVSGSGAPTQASHDVWAFKNDATKARSGSGYWFSGNPSNEKTMQAGIDNSLITRTIDMTRAITANLNAYFAYNINTKEGLPPDSLRIEMSNDGGITWKAINYGVRSFSGVSVAGANPHASYVAASSQTRINCDLSAWAGQVVMLRFRVVTTNNATYAHNENNALSWGGLYIDDITISGTSIEETRATSSGHVGTADASADAPRSSGITLQEALDSSNEALAIRGVEEIPHILLTSGSLCIELCSNGCSQRITLIGFEALDGCTTLTDTTGLMVMAVATKEE